VGFFGRPAGSDNGAGFDEATLVNAFGETRRMTKAEFDALPLGDRIRALLDKSLKFFRGGREVSIKEALGDRY
jgi:hypothetical protein